MWNTYKKTISVLFIVFLLYPIAAHSTDYYVSTTGSDSNSGTLTLPWKTVQKAATTMVAGDTAYVRGGTYSEYMIKFSNSGSSGSPITIKGYTGETAVIDGMGSSVADGRRPVFDIDGVSYITLDGLTIKRGATANVYISYNHAGSTHDITIRNCDMQDFVANDNSGHVLLGTGSDNIIIENNHLHGVQGYHNNASGLFVAYSLTVTIKNNEIHDTNIGIYWKSGYDNSNITTIENNLIYNQTRWGVNLNHRGIIFRNNVVRDVTGIGVLVFEESNICANLISVDMQILHNTVVRTGGGSIVLDRSTLCEGAKNTVVRDNLIYNFTSPSLRGVAVYAYYSSDSSNTTFDHNLIYSDSYSSPIRVLSSYYTTATAPLTGTGNIQQSPNFRNYTNNDFTLQPSSPGRHSASDSTDVGANISLVGINAAPASPPTVQ